MHVPASTLLFITCSIVKLWTLDWEKKDLEIGKYWWFDHFVGLKWIWKMDPDISQETPWCGRVGHVSLLIFCRVRRNLWVSLQWSHLYKGSDIISIFRINPSEMFCLFISKKQLSYVKKFKGLLNMQGNVAPCWLVVLLQTVWYFVT